MKKKLLCICLVVLMLLTAVPGVAFAVDVEPLTFTTEPMIAAGCLHTVALRYDGTVWAWGNGLSGQLGTGTRVCTLWPVETQNMRDTIAVSASLVSRAHNRSPHSVKLRRDGTVWAWGGNNHGQLGNGTSGIQNNRLIPTQVQNLDNITAIATGRGHTVALRSDGTVWIWGWFAVDPPRNLYRTTPTQVPGLSGVTEIAAGEDHVVALRNDGTVWTWGANWHGQLGDNSGGRLTPGVVRNLDNVTTIAAGGGHTVALRNDGTVWTWGQNQHGQLGDNTTSGRVTPLAVRGLGDVKAISAGGDHTIALRNDGAVWAWGANQYGQLGDDTTTHRHSPVQTQNIRDITAISAGMHHTVALRNDGTVWAWGSNFQGQLGDFSAVDRHTPVQVRGPGGVRFLNLLEGSPGGGGPSTPLERVPAQYQHIYDFLQANDFERLFPGYNAFTTVFIDAVPMWDVAMLGLGSSTRFNVVTGLITGGIDGAVDAVMNDPRRVNAVVRDLVNEIAGTNVYSADKEMSALFSFFADSLTALDSNAGYFFTALKEFDSHMEAISRNLQNYYQNIRMLESVRRVSTSPQLTQTINAVLHQYQRDLAEAFGALWGRFAVNKSIDIAVGLVLGKPTVAITSALDLVIGQVPSVGGLETIIVTDNLNRDVMDTFRNAATRITQGYFTSEHVESYQNAFYLARSLQMMRYRAMRTNSNFGATERGYVDMQLTNLEAMTHTNFIFSVPFSQYHHRSPIMTQFVDVGLHWGAQAIQFVNDQDIMRGTSSTTFAPNTDFSRAMVVATLYRMAHDETISAAEVVDVQSYQRFNDVPENAWFAHYVAWAYENNIVTGISQNRFAPGASVTREQFATMMHRYAEVMGYDITLPEDFVLTFPDADLISNWALAGKHWANYNGLIMGTNRGTLNPTGTATRAESATILMRFVMDVAAFQN